MEIIYGVSAFFGLLVTTTGIMGVYLVNIDALILRTLYSIILGTLAAFCFVIWIATHELMDHYTDDMVFRLYYATLHYNELHEKQFLDEVQQYAQCCGSRGVKNFRNQTYLPISCCPPRDHTNDDDSADGASHNCTNETAYHHTCENDCAARRMDTQCSRSSCFKVFISTIIALGITVSCIGLWGFLSDELLEDITVERHHDILRYLSITMSIVGIFIAIIGWIGFLGAAFPSPPLRFLFVGTSSSCIMPCLVIGMISLVYMAELKKIVNNYVLFNMEAYFFNGTSKALVDRIQSLYQCCGLFTMPSSYKHGSNYPNSCCNTRDLKMVEIDGNMTLRCLKDSAHKKTCNSHLTFKFQAIIHWTVGLLVFTIMYITGIVISFDISVEGEEKK
ncbi:hypothetical protein GE061_006952 [Apolygus lucorum]|uniref:Tetraspanin n=1 Tax=Apolygus lucorum TaxID=248454 RepID=A0A8S9WRV9_APOLU|nr:hypothetical protein GE061_006952 [Apolygus lucorum]